MPTLGFRYNPKYKSVADLRGASLIQSLKQGLSHVRHSSHPVSSHKDKPAATGVPDFAHAEIKSGLHWALPHLEAPHSPHIKIFKKSKQSKSGSVPAATDKSVLVPMVAAVDPRNQSVVGSKQTETAKPLSPSQPSQTLANTGAMAPDTGELLRFLSLSLRPYVRRSERLMWVLIALVTVNTTMMTILLFNGGGGNNAQAALTSQVENVASIPSASENGVKVVTEFASNKAITDVGYNLKVQKGTIQTKGHTNCSTPSVPPVENGCGFSLIPSAMGIPTRGVLFKSIQFQGSFGDKSKLRLDIKDFEKGVLTTQVATLEGGNQIGKKTELPEQISQTAGIFIRFWTDKEDMVINKIAIEYYNVDSLHKVSGKISPELAAQGVTGYVYLDANQNTLFDEKTDKPWLCRPNFPGVKQVEVNPDGNFVLLRDDSCYIDVKPDKWYTDDGRLSLPSGKWILVLGDDKGKFPFEVKNSEEDVVVDFTKAKA